MTRIAINRLVHLRRLHVKSQAIAFTEFGDPTKVLKLHEYSINTDPVANPNSILVKFLAWPINPADINQIEGVYPSKPVFHSNLSETPLAIGGNEGVCKVVETGKDVIGFKPGDWAVMQKVSVGTWRTYAECTPDQLTLVPSKGNTEVQAATISVNPCTAYRMLKDFADMKPGDFFIQNGANSGVGRAAIQLGRLWGFRSINVVRNRPQLGDLIADLKSIGADAVVTDEEISGREFRSSLKEITQGSPVKLALNCIGGKSTLNIARQLSPGGHLVTYGAMAKQPITLPPSLFIFKDIHCHGEWVTAWSNRHPKEKQQMIQEILALYRNGEFKDVPVEEFIWKETDSAETKYNLFMKALNNYIAGGHNKQLCLIK
ncbi:hypothetical protein CANCADRAFT_781 [Tortispora caseinolytica NRRL Y-17796]|uniref:enoyl-[acyl-carrier-protein] reductase n=1 Tax=Tortispora caseinolytica NRRL Y-17796 TaxID=767744 RepID=A0A1E4TKB9_9ASCO|nr:hypothetical protein CANCADRAFT_781 [Tortispora caseinolytica NRRL Y-17796]